MGNGTNNGGGQNNAVRSVLLAAVGAYVIYLAYGILKNALEGDPTMPLAAAIPIGALFGVAGAAVIVYAALLWFRQSKGASDASAAQDEEALDEETLEEESLEEEEPEEELEE